MPTETLSNDVKKIVYEYLPRIIKEQPEVRIALWDMLSDKFASKEKTEDRFDILLERLRAQEEKSDRKFEQVFKKLEENDRKFEQVFKKLEENDRKFEQVFKKLEENDRKFEQVFKKLEENDRKFEQVFKKLEENDRKFEQVFKKLEENDRKFEQVFKKLEENDRKFKQVFKKLEENDRKFEQVFKKLEENDKKFKEHSEKFDAMLREIHNLDRKIDKTIEENGKKFNAMLQEIRNVDHRIDKTIGALGARWGGDMEEAFRKAIKATVENFTGTKVERYIGFDNEGMIFGRPDQVEIDVVIRNGELWLMEIKSSVSKADVYAFYRKTQFYEKEMKRKVDKKVIIAPVVLSRELKLARDLNIKVYMAPEDIESEGKTP